MDWLDLLSVQGTLKSLLQHHSSKTSILLCSAFFIVQLSHRYMKWSEVTQSCPTLWDPINCSLPGSSIHGIFQAIVLYWIAISFSRGSSQHRDRTWVSHIVGRRFTVRALTGRTFISKVTSLLFTKLCRLVITFLPRSKCLLISWLQSPSTVILEPPKSDTVSTVSPSISH